MQYLDDYCESIVSKNSNMLVPWLLMAAYCYYWTDAQLLSDCYNDNLMFRLKDCWNDVQHPHKYLIDVESLQETVSLHYISKTDYPTIIRSAARELANKKLGHKLPREEPFDMAPRKPKEAKASQLAEALAFVSVAGTKDDTPYKAHVQLNNHFAIMSDGQLTAGYPITEDFECCPQLELLRAAISKCTGNLSLAELSTSQLSVKGDKLRATVPCLPFMEFPDAKVLAPDANIAVIDDRLKTAFEVCGCLATEAGRTVIEASLLLEANTCTATNRQVLIQYWHGIDLPPALVIPKIFAAAVCKVKAKLIGFGYTPKHSITFHFEGGAWLKTLLYEDQYPDVAAIIDKPSQAVAVSPDFFVGIEAAGAFNDGIVRIENGKVVTDNSEYELNEKATAKCAYNSKLVKLFASYTKAIDVSTYDDRAFFFGDNMRGVICGIGLKGKPHVEYIETEEQMLRRLEAKNRFEADRQAHIAKYGNDDDFIPF